MRANFAKYLEKNTNIERQVMIPVAAKRVPLKPFETIDR